MSARYSFDDWPRCRELQELGPAKTYPKGVTLFEQDGAIREVFHVVAGVVKLACVDRQGDALILDLAFAGDWLGTAAALAATASPTSAATCTRAALQRVPADVFRDLLRHDARLSARVHEWHARALCRQSDWIRQLETSSSRERLAHVIRHLIAALHLRPSARGIRLRLPLRHWELARLIAITPETLSRLLHELQVEGVIHRENGWVIVSSFERLCAECDGETDPLCAAG